MSEESTTRDLVELTRRGYESFSRRDLDALLSLFAPDAVFDTSPAGLGTYKGETAIRGFFEDWIGAFEEFEFEPEQIRACVGVARRCRCRSRPARPRRRHVGRSRSRCRTGAASCFEVVGTVIGTERPYVGIDGFRESLLAWLAPWDAYRSEVVRTIDPGNHVVTIFRIFGRPDPSTSELEGSAAWIWTIRDGKVARIVGYADPAEALEAVRLAE